MKKNKFIICVMFLIFTLTLTSCSFIKQLTCNHEYTITTIKPTCKEKGYNLKECKLCGFSAKSDFVNPTGHTLDEIVEVVEPTCTNEGYTLKKCVVCDETQKTDIVNALGHKYGEYVTVKEPTELSDGYDEATCIVCGSKIKKITTITNYIDLDVIKYSYVDGKTYDVNDANQLAMLYNCAILYNSKTLKCNIKYDVSFEDLMASLDGKLYVNFNYSVQASGETLLGKLKSVTFTFNVLQTPTKNTNEVIYDQYTSANLSEYTKVRSDDFDNFLINTSKLTMECETSEQLFYCLSRKAKPICKEGSDALRIYNKAKEILRNICDDSMSEYEKVKAIHDYIVMNVTYDGKLYDLLYEGAVDINQYAGFYLEGVFDNQLAVCEGISKAMVVLCNIEGIPCVTVTGYQVKNPNGAGHAWNKVKVDGTWYVIDATSDGVIMNSSYEVLSYEYFLVSEAKMDLYCKANNFTGIKCDKEYDIYSNSYFIVDSKKYDYNITSQEELNKLIKYFESNKSTKRTIEFIINFNVGDSPVDEVRLAYSTLLKSSEFSYTYEGNRFLLTISK